MGSQSRDETTASLSGSVGRGASPIPPGQDALVELGVTSGLAMVFGLLQQNWRHHEVRVGLRVQSSRSSEHDHFYHGHFSAGLLEQPRSL